MLTRAGSCGACQSRVQQLGGRSEPTSHPAIVARITAAIGFAVWAATGLAGSRATPVPKDSTCLDLLERMSVAIAQANLALNELADKTVQVEAPELGL